MKKFDYDIVVIGSGTAGTSAAQFAAERGMRVAIVESGSWGGSAVNSIELPLRAISSFSHSFREASHASTFGLSTSSLRYNFPAFKTWFKKSLRATGAGSSKSLEDLGVTCLRGLAHFLSPYELSVGKEIITAQKFIIASGSDLDLGGISGTETVPCLTPDNWLDITRPPENLAIVGGSSTGCEFAEFFASLGSHVVIFELAPHILPREDEEVAPIITKSLESTKNIKVLAQSRVLSVDPSKSKSGGQKYSLAYLRGGIRKTATCDAIFLATGRKPSLDLGLDNAGVKYSDRGIAVDKYHQTSMKHIYAAGSCTGISLPVEYSAYSGALAAANLITKTRVAATTSAYVRFTDTLPSVASVGQSEEECLAKHIKFQKSIIPLAAITSSITSDSRLGFIKLIVDSSSKLIGATVVCDHADLVIPELSLAIRKGLTAMDLASAPVVSTSQSELVRLAARRLIR